MNDIQIRPATPDDAAAIAAIHVSSFVSTYSHLPITHTSAGIGLEGRIALWDHRLRQPEPDRFTLVAKDRERICGFVYLGPSPDPDADDATGHVFSMHVDPPMTGQGVGMRLMEEAVAALKTAGYVSATLWVVADNQGARRFYTRLGWRPQGASRRELLAAGDEKGDEVEVVRYWLDLGAGKVEKA